MKKKKRKYEKPGMKISKLNPFFFNCLKNASSCSTVVQNRVVGSGCPFA